MTINFKTDSVFPCFALTGYGSKDGNKMDNFALSWNIDKIFGMLEDLITTNKATRHFFFYAKMGYRYACIKILFLVQVLLRNERLLKRQYSNTV